MTPSDKPRFAAVLNGLAAVKPGHTAKLTPEALDVWWLALGHWSLSEFEEAAGHLLRNSEFMPNPFHFEQLRKAGEQSPAEAWIEVRQALRTMDWQKMPSLSPRIDQVVRALGGYRALAVTNSDEMHFREKRFAELWEELGNVEEVRGSLPLLTSSNGQRTLAGPKSASDSLPRLQRVSG